MSWAHGHLLHFLLRAGNSCTDLRQPCIRCESLLEREKEGGDGGLGWWRWRVGDEGGVGGVVGEAVADEVGDDEGVSFRDGD